MIVVSHSCKGHCQSLSHCQQLVPAYQNRRIFGIYISPQREGTEVPLSKRHGTMRFSSLLVCPLFRFIIILL